MTHILIADDNKTTTIEMRPMPAGILAAILLDCIAVLASASARERGGAPPLEARLLALRDSTAGDSAMLDSVRQNLERSASARDDSLRYSSWRGLPTIAPAIAVAPLDGPEDLREKIEIIEDRIDLLATERKRIVYALKALTQSRQAQELQLEMLEDLSQINCESDVQLQQRLHDLQHQLSQYIRRIQAYEHAFAALENELDHLKGFAQQYRLQTEDLLKKERPDR